MHNISISMLAIRIYEVDVRSFFCRFAMSGSLNIAATVQCSSSDHRKLRLFAMERSCTDFLSPWLEHLEKDGNFVAKNAVEEDIFSGFLQPLIVIFFASD